VPTELNKKEIKDLLHIFNNVSDDLGKTAKEPYCVCFAEALRKMFKGESIELYACGCTGEEAHYFIKRNNDFIDSETVYSEKSIKEACNDFCDRKISKDKIKQIPWKEATILKKKRCKKYTDRFHKDLKLSHKLLKAGVHN